MVEVKYIKRAGKLYGPYYYKSVRDPDGGVRKIYLGKTNPEAVIPQKKYVRKSLDINPLNLLVIVVIFLALIGLFFFFRGFPVTGQYIVSVNKMVSSNAYLEVDGISQAIPLELIKVGEDWYYNITILDLNLTAGIHTVKIIDNSETVFEQNVFVADDSDSGNETSNETVGNETNESVPPPAGFGILGGDYGVAGSSSSETETSAEWSMFKGYLNRTGVYKGSFSPIGFGKLWNYSTGGAILSSPAIAGGIVYFGSSDNKTYALNATNGTLIWNFTTNGTVRSSPAIAGGIIYFGSDDNKTYALNATNGTLIWNFSTSNSVFSSPAVVNGIVYIGSNDKNIYALNATNGTVIWNFTVRYSIDTSSPAIVGNILYIGGREFNFYALNATNGSLIWNRTLTGDSVGTPAVYNNTVYFGSGDFKLYALNASNGSLLWTYSTNGWVYSPTVADGFVYFGSYDNSLYALNSSTGVYVWNFTTQGLIYSAPLFAGGFLFVSSGDNKTYILNASTGTHQWNYTTNNVIGSSFAAANGIFYVGSSDNNLYAFKSLATGLTNCTTINTSGNYVLLNSVGSAGTCFNITANDVNLNCNGYTINYSQSAVGYGINISGFHAVVRNCRINQTSSSYGNSHGIYLEKTWNVTLDNVFVNTIGDQSSAIRFSEVNNSWLNNSVVRGNGTDNWVVYATDTKTCNFNNNSINASSGTIALGGVAVLDSGTYNNYTRNTILTEYENSVFVPLGTNGLIANNTIKGGPGGGTAILFLGTNTKDYLVTQNTIYSPGGSSAIGVDDLTYGYPFCCNVIDNNIINNSDNGIYLQNTSYWNITNNNIYSNNIGIYTLSAWNIRIDGGNISSIKYSLFITNYSSVNVSNAVIGYNSLINNSYMSFLNSSFVNISSIGVLNSSSVLHYDNVTVLNNIQRNLSSNFTIGNNFISVDSQSSPEFNVSANLTFYIAPGFNTVSMLRNDTPCSDVICKNKVYNKTTGVLTVDVMYFTNYSTAGDSCLNLSDSDTWLGRVSNISSQNFNISQNASLCLQDYNFNGTLAGESVFYLNTSNTVFNCNGSRLIGNYSNTAQQYLRVGENNITVKNCVFMQSGSNDLIYVRKGGSESIHGIMILNNTFINITDDGTESVACVRMDNVSYAYVINNTVNVVRGSGDSNAYAFSFPGKPVSEHILVQGNNISTVYNTQGQDERAIAVFSDTDNYVGYPYVNNVTIINNVISNVTYSIYFIGGNANISYNNITNKLNGIGILASGFGTKNQIYHNYISNVSIGIHLGFPVFSIAAYNYSVTDNIIPNASLYGMYLWNTTNSSVLRNLINNSMIGIFLNYSGNNSFMYNNISSVRTGVFERRSYMANYFYENNLSNIIKYDYAFGLNELSGNSEIGADTIAWYNNTLNNLTGNPYNFITVGSSIVAVNSTGLPTQWNSSVNVSLSVSCGSYSQIYYNISYQTTLANIVNNGLGQVVASSGDTRCSSPGSCDGITCTNNILNMNISNFSSYGVDSCVNLTDSSTFGTKVSYYPATTQNFVIQENTVLCRQAYQFNGSISSISILWMNYSNVVLDCNGAYIVGNGSTSSRPGNLRTHNITVKNCNFWNYSSSLIGSTDTDIDIRGLKILNNNFTNFNGDGVEAIRADNFSDMIIANNIITRMFANGDESGQGIVLLGRPTVRNILIQNNTFDTIYHSTASQAAMGILIQNNDNLPIDTVSNVTVSGNIIRNISALTAGYGYGIYYLGVNSTFQRNNLSDIDGGGIVAYGDYNYFYNNSIINVSYGILMDYVPSLVSRHNIIRQNNLLNNSAYGIYANNASNLTILFNNITNGNTSIYILDGNNINISYNNISYFTKGIVVIGNSNSSNIHKNFINNASYGILIGDSSYNLLTYNYSASDNVINGTALTGASGIGVDYAYNINILGNIINGTYYGISVSNSSYAYVLNNNITGPNSDAMYISGNNNILIKSNKFSMVNSFSRKTTGIFGNGTTSTNTTISYNNFTGFSNSVIDLRNMTVVDIRHNFISNYTNQSAISLFKVYNASIVNNSILNGESLYGIAVLAINSTILEFYNNTINGTRISSTQKQANWTIFILDSFIQPNMTDITKYNNITNFTQNQFVKGWSLQMRTRDETGNLSAVSVYVYNWINNTLVNTNVSYVSNSNGLTPAQISLSAFSINFSVTPMYEYKLNLSYNVTGVEVYNITFFDNVTIIANTSTKTIYKNVTANRSYLAEAGTELILDFGLPVVSLSVSPASIKKGSSASVSCTGTDYSLTSISVSGTISGAICSNAAPVCLRNSCTATCSGTVSPGGSEIITCTGIDGDGNTGSSSATLTVTEDNGGGGEPPEPPKPPLPPPAQVQAQAVEAASRGNLTLIQFPQGLLKFYYTEEEGIMKPRLDLSFDVSSLAYYKPISPTYVPWFIYVIAIITLIVITFAGTTVAENKEEIIDRFRNLRRK